jgi:hypothetical protein
MLATPADALGDIAGAQAGDLRWKLEWSSAAVMLSERVRVLGDHGRAEALASAAVDRMGSLVAQDTSNRDWRDAYLRALTMRAAAREGAGKMADAKRDLAAAQPLIASLQKDVPDNRIVRRDVIQAQTLSAQVVLQEGDRAAADRVARALQLLLEQEDAAPTGSQSGFLGISQVTLAMADAAAGRSAKAEARFAAAHAALAPRVADSRYWRVLDPWVRLSLLRGDAAEAARVQALLSSMGYVPLFDWPPLAVARESGRARAAHHPELMSPSPPVRAPARAQAAVPPRR